MSAFNIFVYGNEGTPVFRGDLKDTAVGVEFSTIRRGGCEQLGFSIPAESRLPVAPPYLGKFFEVRLVDQRGVFWSGRMQEVHFTLTASGSRWDVVVYGFGVNLSDQVYDSVNVQNTQTSTIADNAITSLTQQIDARSVTASGYTITNTAPVTLKLRTAWEIVRFAEMFGDASNTPQEPSVYPDDDGTVRFRLQGRPATPDLYAYIQDLEGAKFGSNLTAAYNRVKVGYNNGASVAQADDTDLQGAGPNGWGFIKTLWIEVPELTQSADANQVTSSLLTLVKAPRMEAEGPLVVKTNVQLLDSNGQAVDLWRVRSGQLLRFADMDAFDDSNAGLTFANSCLIGRTHYSEETQTLTLTPENQDTTVEQMQARARAMLGAKLKV